MRALYPALSQQNTLMCSRYARFFFFVACAASAHYACVVVVSIYPKRFFYTFRERGGVVYSLEGGGGRVK